MQGVATYRIAPKEELQAAERAKPWFEKANIDGVVALRPVGSEQRTTYTPGTWTSPYYSTLWGYYGYGWGSVYIPGTRENETFVTVESIIFSVPRNELLWAAVSETRNPKDLAGFIEELVKASVKEMQKQGLAKGPAEVARLNQRRAAPAPSTDAPAREADGPVFRNATTKRIPG
jgi:hypothetical protein